VVAQKLGITERSVRRILRDLENEGYIEHQRKGRVNTYRLYLDVPLRRPDQLGVPVGELLKILAASGDPKAIMARLDSDAAKDYNPSV
jgi:predicted ArsR family transcriptional regulator